MAGGAAARHRVRMTEHGSPVRVLVVDDHPAVQSGLDAVLQTQPGFVLLGTAADELELWPQFRSSGPDLVLMDYHLPGADGLTLCRRLKTRVPAPKVVIYSAYADSRLVAPATLASADGLVNKAAPAGDLFAVMSRVMAGERVLPPIRSDDIRDALARIDHADRELVHRVLEGRTPAEAAAATGRPLSEMPEVVDRALAALRVEVPTASAVGL